MVYKVVLGIWKYTYFTLAGGVVAVVVFVGALSIPYLNGQRNINDALIQFHRYNNIILPNNSTPRGTENAIAIDYRKRLDVYKRLSRTD